MSQGLNWATWRMVLAWSSNLPLISKSPLKGRRRVLAGSPVGDTSSPLPDTILGGYFTLHGNYANEYMFARKGEPM